VEIGLRKFGEQLAMGGERIMELNLHSVARERTIPAGGIAQADHEIVGVHHLSFDLLARGKRNDGCGAWTFFSVAWVKHARFELDGRIFGGYASKIAGGRMTALATASSIEESFAGVSVAAEQFLDGIGSWNSGRLEPFLGTLMQKGGDIRHLLIRHVGQGRHAFVGTAAANHFANLVTLDVVSDKRRADQIRSARACGVGAVAESAGFRELLATALDGGIFRSGILRSGLRARRSETKEEKERQQQR